MWFLGRGPFSLKVIPKIDVLTAFVAGLSWSPDRRFMNPKKKMESSDGKAKRWPAGDCHSGVPSRNLMTALRIGNNARPARSGYYMKCQHQ